MVIIIIIIIATTTITIIIIDVNIVNFIINNVKEWNLRVDAKKCSLMSISTSKTTDLPLMHLGIDDLIWINEVK